MVDHNISSRSLQGAVILLGFFSSLASSETPVAERALMRNADDAELQWGPCPSFLPAGCAIAVLHGDPANENVDVFFRVPAHSTIPLHWHTSAERMVLVAGVMQVAYDGQDAVILKPGTYAYGPAKQAHRASCTSADPCILFIAFESPLDAVPVDSPGS